MPSYVYPDRSDGRVFILVPEDMAASPKQDPWSFDRQFKHHCRSYQQDVPFSLTQIPVPLPQSVLSWMGKASRRHK